MNHEIAMQWATALESGKYTQTRFALRGTNGMCCLGVLCDLHAQSTGGTWTDDGLSFRYHGSEGVPPAIVNDWCDAPNHAGCAPAHAGLTTLSELNDKGDNFAHIAAIIRRDWESL